MQNLKEFYAVDKPEDEDDLHIRFVKGILGSIAGILAAITVNAIVDLYIDRSNNDKDKDEDNNTITQ